VKTAKEAFFSEENVPTVLWLALFNDNGRTAYGIDREPILPCSSLYFGKQFFDRADAL